MTFKQALLLILVSAIWGSSFIFMKVLVPIYGIAMTSSFRLLSASFFLLILFAFQKYKINWKQNYMIFMVIGIGNSAIPFFLYSFAAQYIDASISVILNSTAPMFGAIFSYLIIKERLGYQKIFGLLIGFIGVGVITSISFGQGSKEVVYSILACVTAAAFYGLSGVITKKYAMHIEAKELTAGSLLFAGIVLIPLVIVFPIRKAISFESISLVIIFGILCTAIAYLIYYYLIKHVGAVKALTVTYLMPAFGIFWSFLFLNERITNSTIFGLFIILLGIFLINSRRKLFKTIKTR